MGKGDPKTQAKRSRAKMAGAMAGHNLAPTPKRKARGRERMAELPQERAADATKTAQEARCRREGRRTTVKDRLAVSGPLSGSDVGRAIRATLGAEDAMSAWQAFVGYDAAMSRYERLVICRPLSPASGALQHVPDRVESADHHTVDTRTEGQRIHDAGNAFAVWFGYEMQLGGRDRALVRTARIADGEVWWDAAASPPNPTARGKALAHALRQMAQMVERRR